MSCYAVSARKCTVLVEREEMTVGVFEFDRPSAWCLGDRRDEFDAPRRERGYCRIDPALGQTEDYLWGCSFRRITRQKYELDVARESSLKIAPFEIFDLEGQPESL